MVTKDTRVIGITHTLHRNVLTHLTHLSQGYLSVGLTRPLPPPPSHTLSQQVVIHWLCPATPTPRAEGEEGANVHHTSH